MELQPAESGPESEAGEGTVQPQRWAEAAGVACTRGQGGQEAVAVAAGILASIRSSLAAISRSDWAWTVAAAFARM